MALSESQQMLLANASRYATPQTIPAIQRSQYLAEALNQMRAQGGQNLRTPVALGANLLALGLTNWSKDKADKQLMADSAADLASYKSNALGPDFANAGQGTPQTGGASITNTAGPPVPPQAAQAPPPPSPAGIAPMAGPPITGGPGAPPPMPAPAPMPAQLDPNAPRGIRNNNFGNLRALAPGHSWPGQVGVDDAGYVKFDSPQDGVNATMMNLAAYNKLHGIDTVSGIVNRWAPGGKDGNDPASYAKYVAGKLGVDPSQKLNMSDPSTLHGLASGIFEMENGPQAYHAAMNTHAATLAPGAPQQPGSPTLSTNGYAVPPPPPPPAPAPSLGVGGEAPPGGGGSPGGMPQQPGGPPTGAPMTPQEHALIASLIRDPRTMDEGLKLAMAIRQRQASPIELNKDEYFDPSGHAQSVHKLQNVQGGSPNAFYQVDPVTGEIKVTANPSYGAVAGGMHMGQDGTISQSPISQKPTFRIPGAPGTYVTDEKGNPQKVADDNFTVGDAGHMLQDITASPQYDKAVKLTEMYRGMVAAASRPGGISDAEIKDNAAQIFSGGVARQFNAKMIDDGQGPLLRLKQFGGEIMSGQKLSPEARQAILKASHDYMMESQAAAKGLFTSKAAFAKANGQDITPFLEPLLQRMPDVPDISGIPTGGGGYDTRVQSPNAPAQSYPGGPSGLAPGVPNPPSPGSAPNQQVPAYDPAQYAHWPIGTRYLAPNGVVTTKRHQ